MSTLIAPLSIQQQWLFSLLQQHRDWNCVAAYAYRLKGSLDLAMLRQSVNAVIQRHGSLRAKIVIIAGTAQQQVEQAPPCQLDPIAIPGGMMHQREQNAQRLLETICDEDIEPVVGPLLHVRLLKLTDSEHWFVVTAHRLIADCSSLQQMFCEVWMLYRAFVQAQLSPLAENPPQYADYALQQQEAKGEWIKRHRGYWERRLTGAKTLQWPAFSPANEVRRGTLGRMSARLSKSRSASLRELARRERTLAAAVMLSVYAAVLWRWCFQRDFILPFKIAGRQSEHRTIIGYFTHILFLRIELTGNENFKELLRKISNEFFRALSHQDFGRMATEKPELLEGIFFQWITWQDDPAGHSATESAGILEPAIERIPIRNFGEGSTAIPPGIVDVEVTFFDTEDGIYGSGVYRADRFLSHTMKQFMEDLNAASEQFVQSPEALLADLHLDRQEATQVH